MPLNLYILVHMNVIAYMVLSEGNHLDPQIRRVISKFINTT